MIPRVGNGVGKKTRRGISKSQARRASPVNNEQPHVTIQVYRPIEKPPQAVPSDQRTLVVGGTSGSSQQLENMKSVGYISRTPETCSDADHDSSDTNSSDSYMEDGQIMEFQIGNNLKLKNRWSGKNHARGNAPPSL